MAGGKFFATIILIILSILSFIAKQSEMGFFFLICTTVLIASTLKGKKR